MNILHHLVNIDFSQSINFLQKIKIKILKKNKNFKVIKIKMILSKS